MDTTFRISDSPSERVLSNVYENGLSRDVKLFYKEVKTKGLEATLEERINARSCSTGMLLYTTYQAILLEELEPIDELKDGMKIVPLAMKILARDRVARDLYHRFFEDEERRRVEKFKEKRSKEHVH